MENSHDPMGIYLRKEDTDHTEDGLEAGIAELITAQTSVRALTRKNAGSLGVHCAVAPGLIGQKGMTDDA
jgi:hypothetical protein